MEEGLYLVFQVLVLLSSSVEGIKSEKSGKCPETYEVLGLPCEVDDDCPGTHKCCFDHLSYMSSCTAPSNITIVQKQVPLKTKKEIQKEIPTKLDKDTNYDINVLKRYETNELSTDIFSKSGFCPEKYDVLGKPCKGDNDCPGAEKCCFDQWSYISSCTAPTTSNQIYDKGTRLKTGKQIHKEIPSKFEPDKELSKDRNVLKIQEGTQVLNKPGTCPGTYEVLGLPCKGDKDCPGIEKCCPHQVSFTKSCTTPKSSHEMSNVTQKATTKNEHENRLMVVKPDKASHSYKTAFNEHKTDELLSINFNKSGLCPETYKVLGLPCKRDHECPGNEKCCPHQLSFTKSCTTPKISRTTSGERQKEDHMQFEQRQALTKVESDKIIHTNNIVLRENTTEDLSREKSIKPGLCPETYDVLGLPCTEDQECPGIDKCCTHQLSFTKSCTAPKSSNKIKTADEAEMEESIKHQHQQRDMSAEPEHASPGNTTILKEHKTDEILSMNFNKSGICPETYKVLGLPCRGDYECPGIDKCCLHQLSFTKSCTAPKPSNEISDETQKQWGTKQSGRSHFLTGAEPNKVIYTNISTELKTNITEKISVEESIKPGICPETYEVLGLPCAEDQECPGIDKCCTQQLSLTKSCTAPKFSNKVKTDDVAQMEGDLIKYQHQQGVMSVGPDHTSHINKIMLKEHKADKLLSIDFNKSGICPETYDVLGLQCKGDHECPGINKCCLHQLSFTKSCTAPKVSNNISVETQKQWDTKQSERSHILSEDEPNEVKDTNKTVLKTNITEKIPVEESIKPGICPETYEVLGLPCTEDQECPGIDKCCTHQISFTTSCTAPKSANKSFDETQNRDPTKHESQHTMTPSNPDKVAYTNISVHKTDESLQINFNKSGVCPEAYEVVGLPCKGDNECLGIEKCCPRQHSLLKTCTAPKSAIKKLNNEKNSRAFLDTENQPKEIPLNIDSHKKQNQHLEKHTEVKQKKIILESDHTKDISKHLNKSGVCPESYVELGLPCKEDHECSGINKCCFHQLSSTKSCTAPKASHKNSNTKQSYRIFFNLDNQDGDIEPKPSVEPLRTTENEQHVEISAKVEHDTTSHQEVLKEYQIKELPNHSNKSGKCPGTYELLGFPCEEDHECPGSEKCCPHFLSSTKSCTSPKSSNKTSDRKQIDMISSNLENRHGEISTRSDETSDIKSSEASLFKILTKKHIEIPTKVETDKVSQKKQESFTKEENRQTKEVPSNTEPADYEPYETVLQRKQILNLPKKYLRTSAHGKNNTENNPLQKSIKRRPGACPAIRTVRVGLYCENDNDCPAPLICCNYGAVHESICILPRLSIFKSRSKPFFIGKDGREGTRMRKPLLHSRVNKLPNAAMRRFIEHFLKHKKKNYKQKKLSSSSGKMLSKMSNGDYKKTSKKYFKKNLKEILRHLISRFKRKHNSTKEGQKKMSAKYLSKSQYMLYNKLLKPKLAKLVSKLKKHLSLKNNKKEIPVNTALPTFKQKFINKKKNFEILSPAERNYGLKAKKSRNGPRLEAVSRDISRFDAVDKVSQNKYMLDKVSKVSKASPDTNLFYSEQVEVFQEEKPGKCPAEAWFAKCKSDCLHDKDCPGEKKCCSNGCGNSCVKPVMRRRYR